MTNGSQICYATRELVESNFDACGKLSCDFEIIAKDNLGNETSVIPRDPTTKGLKALTLSVKSLDGSDLNKGVSYSWNSFAKNPHDGGGGPLLLSTQPTVTASTVGKYTVDLTRAGVTCSAEIILSSTPCIDTPEPTIKCETKALTGVTDEITNRIRTLAPGDIVRCGDFNVEVLEITGGPFEGWDGRGFVKVPYMNAEVSIIFQKAVFNDCYQLTNANATPTQPTVFTEYDPTWSNVVDVDEIIEGLEYEFLQLQINNALARLEVYQGSQADADECKKIYDNIVRVRDKIANSPAFPAELKTQYLTEIDKVLAGMTCTMTPGTVQGGRIAAGGCDISAVKNIFSEAGKLLANPMGYVIAKGGTCLKGFAFDLAGQYIVSLGMRSILGQPSDFSTIYREDISIASAIGACGNSVLESIRGKCDVCEFVISSIVGMADDIKKQYDEKVPIKDINYVRVLGSGLYAAIGEVVGKYAVAPVLKNIQKYGAVLVRKAFQDKLRVPKVICDVIFVGNLCFAQGTPVMLPNQQGFVPIEQLTDSSFVYSRNPYTGVEEARKVLKPFNSISNRMVKVFAGGDTIFTTPNHPFYVIEKQAFVPAQLLQKGFTLKTANPTTANIGSMPYLARSGIEIDSVAIIDTTVKVYNFEVQDFHTYFVGKQAIWVHNANCGPKPLIPIGSAGYGELGHVIYKNVKKQVGDNLTGHHIPSTKYMETLQKELLDPFNPNPRNFTKQQIEAIKKWDKEDVYTIMVEETKSELKASRHFRTTTYGTKNRNSPPRFAKSPKEVFEEEIQNLYDIYSDDGLLTPDAEAQINRFKKIMQYKFNPLFN